VKKVAKNIVAAILGWQVRRLRKKNNFRIIAVVGSIGKTSTKMAIAETLRAGLRMRHQEGNYNDLVSVPLVFFGEDLPSLFNPLAWLAVFWRNENQLRRPYPFDVVVLELGSDGPGQIQAFKEYLRLEIGVLTSITPEHMSFFKDMDQVAKEELSINGFSSLVIANKDLADEKYLAVKDDILTYGIGGKADFQLDPMGKTVFAGGQKLLDIEQLPPSRAQQYSLLAAVATAYKLGMTPDLIKDGIKNIKPAPGRMQVLKGINGSTIIDDTYNASPDAVRLALDYLYSLKAPQKIALLGNMNELGDYSKGAHQEIGEYCDPKQLALVVTLGPDANEVLAPVAETKGCTVRKFDSPYKAGEFLKDEIKPGAVILVKGSQNKVFAEEAIKPLLADPADQEKLVRQSPRWLETKRKAFE